jgi:hypothetical protein
MNLVLTGSSTGIGRTLAAHLLARGHHIWGLARSDQADFVAQHAGAFSASRCDVADWPQVAAANLGAPHLHPMLEGESPDLAAQLLVTGARDGSFTNKSLEDYIPAGGKEPDFVNARKVINGDTAKNGEAIAAIARRYAGVLSGTWPRVFKPNGREGGPR